MQGRGKCRVVISMGNPRVFFPIPRPIPIDNPYPQGHGYSHGLLRVDPRVHPYPYPWQVTHRYTISVTFHNTPKLTLTNPNCPQRYGTQSASCPTLTKH